MVQDNANTSEIYYTNTEKKILSVLSDGLPHEYSELLRCLNDDMALMVTLASHITHIRKKIIRLDQDIVCTISHRKHCYRHMKLLVPNNQGVTSQT